MATQGLPVIAIAGGSGCGKSSLACALIKQSETPLTLLAQDRYYKPLTHLPAAAREEINFDHPGALEFELMAEHLAQLKAGAAIDAPVYNFTIHDRDGIERIEPAKAIVIEGTLILAVECVRDLIDYAVFLDTPDDIRLLRRVKRDLKERARTIAYIEKQYMTQTRPMYEEFILPSRNHAQLVLDGNMPVGQLTVDLLGVLKSCFGEAV